MWNFDTKSLIIACFVAGGKVLYDKVVDIMTKNQYIDRGIIPKWDQLSAYDNQIPSIVQQYNKVVENYFEELTNFCNIYKNQTFNLQKSFSDFLMQKVIDENIIFDEKDVKYDEMNNLVWILADPDDTIPFNERKVIFLNSSIIDFESGSEKAIQGFVTQLLTSKILKETVSFGSLHGCIVICSASYGNHMPYHIFNHTKIYPDAIVLCEPTGSVEKGPVGFGIAQKGELTANISLSGSDSYKKKVMSRIAKEVKQVPNPSTRDPFLGKGKMQIDPSQTTDDTIAIKRTLTFGETADQAMNEIHHLPIVQDLKDKSQSFAITKSDDVGAWKTPRETRVMLAATEAYRRTVSPWVTNSTDPNELQLHPFFVEREISDNLSGYPARIEIPEGFEWDETGDGVQPPTFALGAGFMNSPNEDVETDHLNAVVSVLSRFPSLLVEEFENAGK